MTCSIFAKTLFSLYVFFPNASYGLVKNELGCYECRAAAYIHVEECARTGAEGIPGRPVHLHGAGGRKGQTFYTAGR